MDLDTDDAFCTILADECKAKVISLDYRLCPEHNFPAPIDDAMALWDYVQANAAALGIDGARVAVAGDSAGGLISSVICQQVRDAGGLQPAAQLLAYPWLSTQLAETGSALSCAECFPLTSSTMEFFNATVFPEGKHIDHPFANPLHNDNLANLPPAIIGTAGFDPIRDQGNDYADRLKAVGNQVTHYCFNSLSHSYLSLGNVSKNAEKAGITLARDLAKII
jgi:acetyl esterase